MNFVRKIIISERDEEESVFIQRKKERSENQKADLPFSERGKMNDARMFV